jgi:hypothetical protein
MPDDQTIVEGDAGFLGMASRLNPLQLQPGMVQYAENMRLDRGVAQTRKGAKRVADEVATDRVPVALPFTLGNSQPISAATYNLGQVTIALTAHGYTSGQIINIRGAAQSDYNGDFPITVVDTNTFRYNISGTPASPATGTLTAQNGPVLQNSYLGGIFASCVFSNPSLDDANEYIALASTDRVYLWRQGSAIIEKTYPSSADELIENGDEVSILQAFNRLYVLRSAPSFGASKPVATLTRIGTTVTLTTANPHDIVDQQTIKIEGASPAAFNGECTATFVNSTTLTYTCAPGITAASGTGPITLAGKTVYGPRAISAGGTTVSGTVATIHCTAHGYPAGATVRLLGSAIPAFDQVEYRIATVSANSFTITVPSGTAPDTTTAGRTVQRVKPPLFWDGQPATNFERAPAGIPFDITYRRMRSVPWATYLGNRLWIPDGRDAITVSDVLDPDLYDPFFQNFRTNQGSNDYLIGIHPWVEGQALIFLRRSIWLATLQEDYNSTENIFTVDSAVSRLTLVTNEVGCSARRSIQTAGQFVFFLSDSGIYRLDSKLDLKLRGDTLPLSEPIADQLEGLDDDTARLAVGMWFNNRYYLALATGGSPYNNTILIWNALNNQWESRDTYATGMRADDFLVTTYNGQRRLFASSLDGKLFLLEESEAGDDALVSGNDPFAVPGILLTRRYGWRNLDAKRLLRAKASVLLEPSAACTLDAVTTDYDADFQIAALTNTSDREDYTLKAPLRCKATALDLRFRTSVGRPVLRAISAEAAMSGPASSETRTLN